MNNNENSTIDQTVGNPVKITTPDTNVCIDEGVASFFDAEPGFTTTVESKPDSTYGVGASDITSIEEWLARPVEIHRLSDGIGTNAAFSLAPWTLFFNTPSIKRKLDNYALLRCKLHVKVVVNASPIWWGTSVVSYRPLTDMLVADVSNSTSQVSSMRPHFYLNPTTSQGGCLCLPFFFNENWLDVQKKADFDAMGTLYFKYLNDAGLRCSVTPTAQKVEYTFFAWASDVELAQTTSGVALQAANEYATGPVSSIASSIAKVAGKLKTISWLAPYAKATEISATAVGQVAHIFGFSRSPVIDNPKPMKNLPFGSLANCGTHEVVDQLSVDPKNELCVDSRTVGLDGSDEMTIQSIATREMFLGSAEWLENDVANTVLYNTHVNPSYIYAFNATTHLPSPLAFVAKPFMYWRGDITIRIVVAASGYHRGRLLVQWDPQAQLTSTTPVNEVASKIMDLSVTRDMEFTVPFAAHTPWLKNTAINDYTSNSSFRVGGVPPLVLPLNEDVDNGYLSLRVLNPATGITNTNEILDVMIFVKGAENFSVAAPRNFDSNLAVVTAGYTLQADDVPDHSESGDFSPLGTSPNKMIQSTPVGDDAMALVCMGEEIKSFRTLLKRYCYSGNVVYPFAGTISGMAVVFWSILSRWPLPRGHMTDGIDTCAAGTCNITKMTLFNYLQGAFVGMRGSSRWKFNCGVPSEYHEITVARTQIARTVAGYAQHFAAPQTTPSKAKESLLPDYDFAGYSLTNPQTQTGVEIDSPQYSRYRFVPSSQYGIPLGMASQDTNTDSLELRFISNRNQLFDRTSVSMHHAVGDDFSFFFFLNTPVWYTDPIVT